MTHLDVSDNMVAIRVLHSPRVPVVMKRLKATHSDGRWWAPAHRALDVVDALHNAHPERSEAFEDLEYLIRYGGTPAEVHSCLAIKGGMEVPAGVPELRKPLYPYQEQAVAFLHQAGSGILADEPGLGKTLQGIAFALMTKGPCLVVCPATAKHVWAREIAAACSGADAVVATVSGRHAQAMPKARFVIINHDILADHKQALGQAGFGTLIVDEAHRCKNIRAQRTQALIHIADQVPRKLLLSGTIMMNNAEDMFPPLRIVRPSTYPDFGAFVDRYMTTRSIRKRVKGRWKKVSVREGSRNLPDLHDRMSGFTIRRTLRQVRDQLPDIRHSIHAIDLPDDLLAKYKGRAATLRQARPGEAFRLAHSAIDVCIEAKERVIAELIEDRLAAERKMLVFSTRLALLDAAQAPLHESEIVRIDGSVSTDVRRNIEDRFQQDEHTKVFLGQTRACGEALTLDAADTVIIADADWSPQANEQAIRRAMRINTNHPIEVIWLIVKGTLDEARMEVLERKKAEFATVVGDVLGETLKADRASPQRTNARAQLVLFDA